MRRFNALCLAGAALLAAPAQAGTTIASDFTRTSPVENLTAPFTAPFGTNTAGTYTGFVEVLVSGTGFSFGPSINDAFYFLGGGNTGAYYKLGIGTSANGMSPFDTTTFAAQYITFIEGVGFVAPGTAPAYAANNTYRFVIDLGALNSALGFGVLDGNFTDNGGQYDVSVWQLVRGAGVVPEPATWLLLILGFGVVGSALRRARPVRVSYAV